MAKENITKAAALEAKKLQSIAIDVSADEIFREEDAHSYEECSLLNEDLEQVLGNGASLGDLQWRPRK